MRVRDPMLAVAREDEHEQGSDEGERFSIGKYLLEHPPCGNADKKADEQRKDLPIEGDRRDQACSEIEDGTEEWTERHERRNEFSRSEKFCDPCEGPVIPIETGEREEQSVGDDGYESN